MKDKIAVGSISGVIGGTIGLTLSYSMYRLGISPISSINVAASLVVLDILNLTPTGVIFSIITHLAVASLFGVLLLFILKFFGKEYWAMKGIMFGALFCLLMHSYFIPLMRTDLQVRSLFFNTPSWGTILATHTLIGLVDSTILVKYFFKKETAI